MKEPKAKPSPKSQASTPLITEDMTIGDVISKYPSTIEVLLRNGVHCVGCGAKTFEALGDGLRSHGKSDEEINTLLAELNSSIEDTSEQGDVQITNKAVSKLKELIKTNGKDGYGLRVQVVPGGCAGFQYGFDFENTKQANDTTLDVEGVTFYLDSESFGHLRGARIDYVDTLQEAGFRITNPNAKGGCGCGKSFS